jgi:hypothetical protein
VDREVSDALPTGFDLPVPAFADDQRLASAELVLLNELRMRPLARRVVSYARVRASL